MGLGVVKMGWVCRFNIIRIRITIWLFIILTSMGYPGADEGSCGMIVDRLG